MAEIDETAIHPGTLSLQDLKDNTPDDAYVVSLGLVGSDSIDAAVKMAIAYRKTKLKNNR